MMLGRALELKVHWGLQPHYMVKMYADRCYCAHDKHTRVMLCNDNKAHTMLMSEYTRMISISVTWRH